MLIQFRIAKRTGAYPSYHCTLDRSLVHHRATIHSYGQFSITDMRFCGLQEYQRGHM